MQIEIHVFGDKTEVVVPESRLNGIEKYISSIVSSYIDHDYEIVEKDKNVYFVIITNQDHFFECIREGCYEDIFNKLFDRYSSLVNLINYAFYALANKKYDIFESILHFGHEEICDYVKYMYTDSIKMPDDNIIYVIQSMIKSGSRFITDGNISKFMKICIKYNIDESLKFLISNFNIDNELFNDCMIFTTKLGLCKCLKVLFKHKKVDDKIINECINLSLRNNYYHLLVFLLNNLSDYSVIVVNKNNIYIPYYFHYYMHELTKEGVLWVFENLNINVRLLIDELIRWDRLKHIEFLLKNGKCIYENSIEIAV